jgi:clan AA aspartic protease
MIRGVVNAGNEAVVRLRVRGPAGTELPVDAVVDTGFTGSLLLPVSTVAALGLKRRSIGGVVLADGSTRQCDTHLAEVWWDGLWWPVIVHALDPVPLLGMRLLAWHELRMVVVPGGAVEITRLP